jgi:hypothetical protein
MTSTQHHDLANALAVVTGYLEIALTDPNLRQDTREALEEAWQAAEQAQATLVRIRAEVSSLALSA